MKRGIRTPQLLTAHFSRTSRWEGLALGWWPWAGPVDPALAIEILLSFAHQWSPHLAVISHNTVVKLSLRYCDDIQSNNMLKSNRQRNPEESMLSESCSEARIVLAVRTSACLIWLYSCQLRYKVKLNSIMSLSHSRDRPIIWQPLWLDSDFNNHMNHPKFQWSTLESAALGWGWGFGVLS